MRDVWVTQKRDDSRVTNRAAATKRRGARLVTWFVIPPCKVVWLERIRYDKPDPPEEGGEGAPVSWKTFAASDSTSDSAWPSVPFAVFLTQSRHKCFADSSVPSLTLRLLHFPFPFIWIFGYLFLPLWAAETTTLSWREGDFFFSRDKPSCSRNRSPSCSPWVDRSEQDA